MPETTYRLIAMGMRYFFVAAILFILARIVHQSMLEYREIRRIKRQLDGTYASYILFIRPESLYMEQYVLSRENTIGRSRKCDVRIRDRSVKRRHTVLYEKNGEMYIAASGRKRVQINGTYLKRQDGQLADGDVVTLGDASFVYHTRLIEVDYEQD